MARAQGENNGPMAQKKISKVLGGSVCIPKVIMTPIFSAPP